MRKSKNFLKIYNNTVYKWVLIISSMLLLMVLMGIIDSCYAVFIIPITTNLGISRGKYAVCQSLIYMFCTVSSAICWKLYKKFGFIKIIRVACLVLIVFYFCYSSARSIQTFYIISSVIGFCLGLSTTTAVPILLRGWFKEKYSIAVGIALMGNGIGGMIFTPLANIIIIRYGWQTAYRILAFVMSVVALPVVFLLFRENSDKDEVNHRETTKNEQIVIPKDRECGCYPSKKYVTKKILMIVLLIFTMASTTLVFILTPYLQDIGYSGKFASTCAAAAMATLAIGKIFQGIFLTKFNLKLCSYISFSAILMGLMSLVFFKSRSFMIVPVLAAVGVGCPYGTVAIPALAFHFSVNIEEERIFVSQFTAMINAGAAIGPLFAGVVFDVTSSYVPMFICCAILTFLCVLAIPKVFHKSKSHISNRMRQINGH